jgi:hypothetical protein
MGVDYHPSFQQITFFDQETGECGERRLNHSNGEAEKFYRELQQRGVSCAWGWRPPAIHAGSSGYSRNWVSRCGLAIRRERRIAKVAMARKLAVRLYWMWRNGWEHSQSVEFGSHAEKLVTGHGVN